MAACCGRSLDHNVPLHVDCSVEYELPPHARPPPGLRMEPLLMIHPCHLRRMDVLRRRPFGGMQRHRMKPYRQPWMMQPLPSYQQTYNPYGYCHPWNARPRMTPYSQRSVGFDYV